MANAYKQRWNPDIYRYEGGAEMLRSFDFEFAMFAEQTDLKAMLKATGYKMRGQAEHTVVKVWPNRMSKGGSKEEFMIRLATCYAGFERYVECVREK